MRIGHMLFVSTVELEADHEAMAVAGAIEALLEPADRMKCPGATGPWLGQA